MVCSPTPKETDVSATQTEQWSYKTTERMLSKIHVLPEALLEHVLHLHYNIHQDTQFRREMKDMFTEDRRFMANETIILLRDDYNVIKDSLYYYEHCE
jgi:hypothetical protein